MAGICPPVTLPDSQPYIKYYKLFELYCLIPASDLLLLAQLEVLGALDAQLLLRLALLALQSQRDLLGGFGLLVEDGLCLSTESHLLVVVSALALREGEEELCRGK